MRAAPAAATAEQCMFVVDGRPDFLD